MCFCTLGLIPFEGHGLVTLLIITFNGQNFPLKSLSVWIFLAKYLNSSSTEKNSDEAHLEELLPIKGVL